MFPLIEIGTFLMKMSWISVRKTRHKGMSRRQYSCNFFAQSLFPDIFILFCNLSNRYQIIWKPHRLMGRILIQRGHFHQQLYFIYMSWLLCISIDLGMTQSDTGLSINNLAIRNLNISTRCQPNELKLLPLVETYSKFIYIKTCL
jgi:hypothetical protein